MCTKFENLKLVFLFICIFFISAYVYADTIYTMPERYAYVVDKNTSDNDNEFTDWGGALKWKSIVLWGRCPTSYENSCKYYWDYGDGDKSVAVIINSFDDSNPTSKSSYYMCSDSHQYASKFNQPITNYTACLVITDNNDVEISRTPISVKAVDFKRYSNSKEDNRAKQSIIENIAKGRGLTWLYLKQDLTKLDSDYGSWIGYVSPSYSLNATFPVGSTALSLLAFMQFGHGINERNKDVFTDTVDIGIDYILRNANVTTGISDTNTPIDDSESGECDININSNGTIGNDMRVCFHSGGAYNWGYENGIVTYTLGMYTAKRGQLVTVDGHSMSYDDVIADLVDWAAWSQMEKGWSGVSNPDDAWGTGGWGYGPNDYKDSLFGNYINCPPRHSITQWYVLGFIEIERNWAIKPPAYVRRRLANYIKKTQFSQIFNSVNYDGAGFYDHEGDKESNPPNSPYFPDSSDMFITGTAALLQASYYVSLDKNILDCDCANCTTFPVNDFSLQRNCLKVQRMINFIGRYWNTAHSNDGGMYRNYLFASSSYLNFYSMYSLMKGLRLNQYQKSGVNDGKIYDKDNFPVSGNFYQWEDLYIDVVLKNQEGSGQWNGINSDTQGTIDTAFALLLLTDNLFNSVLVIKT